VGATSPTIASIMTATATRAPTAETPGTAAAGRPEPPPIPRHEPGAELALAAVTLTVIIGFDRVFSGVAFAGPLLVIGATTHLGLVIARRRGLGLGLTTVGAVIGFVILSSWLFFLPTTRLLAPTPGTWIAASSALHASWSSFQQVVAPAAPQPGFLLAAAFGVWFAVFLADWAAFRLWAAIEALVPMLTLFVFTALVGAPQGQIFVTALFTAAVLVFVLVHRVAQRERSTAWLTNQVDRGSSWLLRVGVVLIVGAVAAGSVVGPHLPGARDNGIFSWRGDRSGPSSRVTISPLVDIRSRLVDNADRRLFTVESSRRAYWRLTALDTFDGQIWKSSGHYASVDGRLPGSIIDPGSSGAVEQKYTISALSALWLPAASAPVSIDAATKVRFQKDTSTLIVDTNLPTSDNQTYTVRSVIPDLTADQLRAADLAIPPAITNQDLVLPTDLSSTVKTTAESVVAGAATPYDRAMALQTFFRDTGGFVYDLSVRPGHGDSAIDEFLRDRRGYCEQFAGTFAAMARSVGLPARVAVGFTPGITSPDDPNRYTVEGEHAHAWPEVYLGQYGWVPFEPTPGRGAASSTSYTGVPDAQFEANGVTTTSTVPTATTSPASVPGSGANAGNNQGADELAGGGSSTGHGSSVWPARLTKVGLFAFGLASLYGLIVPTALALRRRRRRTRAGDGSARVRVAWIESEEAIAVTGEIRRPAETGPEFARRAGARLTSERDQLVALADAADAAEFSPAPLDDLQADQAEHTAMTVRASVVRMVPWWRRARRHFDGRPLLHR
jgi:transglutaminase-like putative cysteine protease